MGSGGLYTMLFGNEIKHCNYWKNKLKKEKNVGHQESFLMMRLDYVVKYNNYSMLNWQYNWEGLPMCSLKRDWVNDILPMHVMYMLHYHMQNIKSLCTQFPYYRQEAITLNQPRSHVCIIYNENKIKE